MSLFIYYYLHLITNLFIHLIIMTYALCLCLFFSFLFLLFIYIFVIIFFFFLHYFPHIYLNFQKIWVLKDLLTPFSCGFVVSTLTLCESLISNETGSRSPCMRPRSDPPKMKNSNVVRSRLIILINEEINKANWMVSNSAKLDRRTKQHTQFGVSASNGSRDMARTKSWRKNEKKIKKNN